MRTRLLFLSLLFACFACSTGEGEQSTEDQTTFDKTLWNTREGIDYPYRDQMVNDVLYNDTVRDLSKQQLINLLGDPDRIQEGHLYYTVSQKRLFNWPLHTKTLVVKLSDDKIEWIKLHE